MDPRRIPLPALTLTGMARSGASPERVGELVAGRTVVVTGASRGIGAATALRLGAVGAHVVLLARTAGDLDAVAERVRRAAARTGSGGTATVVPLDLRDLEAATRVGDRIVAEHGAPHVVVSNAGHSINRFVADYADRLHDVTRTAGVNYLGPVALLLRLLPPMTRAGRGHLIGVSSTSIRLPGPGFSVYGASKAAFDAWLRAVAPELIADGVAVTTLRLPLVHTAMSAVTPVYRRLPGMMPDDVAALVCHAIVARPRVVEPWWTLPLGAVMDTAPKTVDRAMSRYVRLARSR